MASKRVPRVSMLCAHAEIGFVPWGHLGVCSGHFGNNLWGDIVGTNSAFRRGGAMDNAPYPYHRHLPQFRPSVSDTFLKRIGMKSRWRSGCEALSGIGLANYENQ